MMVTGRDGYACAIAGLAPVIARASAPIAQIIACLTIMDFSSLRPSEP
jgi:hypothetical protein